MEIVLTELLTKKFVLGNSNDQRGKIFKQLGKKYQIQ